MTDEHTASLNTGRSTFVPKKILHNAVRCSMCNDVIESTHVHDFKWCKCGAIAVDGGRDYLRRTGTLDAYEELSVEEDV